ncbi:hypothetical protein GGX14DRAFT_629395 [Mycena pura]|uniref:Uncharacterized protein n=1 Tax=Mycena pura TaxID=153505 RepID=A0AAD7E4S4_9AGAR|nr:hypothetical protein GGX14DRAFT_629395 [Mycena pura]
MGLVGHVVGGAVFGLTARFYQLGILRRPMMSNPTGHAACVGFFAGAGYFWWKATVYMQGVLSEKERELRLRREFKQALGEKLLADAVDPGTAAASPQASS